MARVTLLGSRNDASHKGAPNFKASRDVPSLAGKVIIITGGAGGLGRQATIDLARHGKPSRIYVADLPHLAEQNTELTRQITLEAFGDTVAANAPTEIRFLGLDLGSFKSVQECAAQFTAQERQLDILILNAGVLRTLPMQTAEGHELHFGINYLGHALLTRLLTPILLQTAQQPNSDVRVVVLSSEGHLSAPRDGIDFQTLKTDCKKMVSR
jgi:NAD(P)-dependent dehydrogenase (short-subunit alcohol dehydrogenase family)